MRVLIVIEVSKTQNKTKKTILFLLLTNGLLFPV